MEQRTEEEIIQFDLDEHFCHYFQRKDDGLAELLLRQCKEYVRMVNKEGESYIWSLEKKLWLKSDSMISLHFLRDELERIVRWAFGNVKGEDRKKQLKHILDHEVHKVSCFSGIFSKLRGSTLRDDTFESKINTSDPDVLPILDGKLVCLRDGSVRDRHQKDLFSFECPVHFLGLKERCPLAERFFRETFVEDVELIDYAQEVCGYMMTGHAVGKALFLWWGKGNNGKTTLMELMNTMLGPLYAPCDKQLLLKQAKEKGRDAASPSLMVLKGRRLVSCCETSADQKLDEPQVKLLTGGDTISGRDLYKSEEQFQNVAKITMLTNELPAYNTQSVALRYRLKMLPFCASFTLGTGVHVKQLQNVYKADLAFVQSLKSARGLSEMFTVIVRGAICWYERGRTLVEAEVCRVILQNQLDQQNPLIAFIDECCEPCQGNRVNAGQFHATFKVWCEEQELKAPKPGEITKRMEELGYPYKRGSSRDYEGLKLLPKGR